MVCHRELHFFYQRHYCVYGEVELNPGPVTFTKTNNVLLKGFSVKHFRGKTTPILD